MADGRFRVQLGAGMHPSVIGPPPPAPTKCEDLSKTATWAPESVRPNEYSQHGERQDKARCPVAKRNSSASACYVRRGAGVCVHEGFR